MKSKKEVIKVRLEVEGEEKVFWLGVGNKSQQEQFKKDLNKMIINHKIWNLIK